MRISMDVAERILLYEKRMAKNDWEVRDWLTAIQRSLAEAPVSEQRERVQQLFEEVMLQLQQVEKV